MKKISFDKLQIGDRFYKEGIWFERIEDIRSGPCQCLSANAKTVQDNSTPLRLYQGSEEVEVNE